MKLMKTDNILSMFARKNHLEKTVMNMTKLQLLLLVTEWA